MPALRNAPEKPFTKVIISKGYGFHTPQDGSVCKIKIIADESNLIAGLDDEKTKEVVVGDVDDSVDRVIEDCIRTMKEEEECCVTFPHPDSNIDCIIPVDCVEEIKDDGNSSVHSDSVVLKCESDSNDALQNVSEFEADAENGKNVSETAESLEPEALVQSNTEANDFVPSTNCDALPNVEIQFQLLSYTREPEIWEMSITEKWRRASYHKQRGLELYARGAYQYAFRRFGLTLKYVISLEHDVPSGQEEGMDIKGLKLSCYLNVAACQMRHHNFESVVINSSKALALQPNNAKALYRRGAAYLQLQEYEKSKEDLTAAQQLEPKNQAIAKQLQVLRSQVQKLNQYYASAMKKMFS